jgi:hypothetical protein
MRQGDEIVVVGVCAPDRRRLYWVDGDRRVPV